MTLNLQNRQQLLGILAVGVVALLVCDRLVFSPLTRTWKARTARIAELKKSVTQGSTLLAREGSIRMRWDTMRTNTLSSQMSVSEGQVVKAFDRWSQDSRIGISAIRPQAKRAAEDYATLECRVDAFGNLSALTRFLYDIERDPLGLRVEVVEVTSRDNSGQQLTVGLQVSGLVLNPSETP
jgi:hypothetical protein